MAGRVIAGRYILEEPIGHGGMGRVWRARDQLLNRKVALKEVLLPVPIDEGEAAAYQRTLREARTVARLNHPNIVTIYDVAEEDGRLWIVMELVPSGSLEERLAAHGPMTAPRAARLGQQLLSALAAVHAAGVLHRDVKPNNVLIAPGGPGDGLDDRAVLTDFGIARSEDDSRITQANVVMGSAGYTAPERLNGHDATPASDLWSLGATLYAAVEGHGPYQRDSKSSMLAANAHEAPPPAPSAGRLAPLIEALLRREPHARPSAAVAARILAEILRQMPDETAPASFVAVTSLDPIPAESVLQEIAEPAEWAEPGQQETLLPAPPWPTPRGEPTQTSPIQSPAAPDLFQQLASETGGFPALRAPRPRPGLRGPPRRAARAAVAIVVIAGIGAGGFFLLKPRFIDAKPQANSTATKSAPPSADRDRIPVAVGDHAEHYGQRELVRAIDMPNDVLPPNYQTETSALATWGLEPGSASTCRNRGMSRIQWGRKYTWTRRAARPTSRSISPRTSRATWWPKRTTSEASASTRLPDEERLHRGGAHPRNGRRVLEIRLQWERGPMRMDVLLFTLVAAVVHDLRHRSCGLGRQPMEPAHPQGRRYDTADLRTCALNNFRG